MAKTYVFALAGYLRGLSSGLSQALRPAEELLTLVAKGFETDQVLAGTLATVMVINLDQNELKIANAGQPKPLLISVSCVSKVNVDGALPGLSYHMYQANSVYLEPKQRLLIYSDGLLDAVEEVPLELEELLLAGNQLSLNSLADNLMAFFIAKSQQEKRRDDCTIILLENSGTENQDFSVEFISLD